MHIYLDLGIIPLPTREVNVHGDALTKAINDPGGFPLASWNPRNVPKVHTLEDLTAGTYSHHPFFKGK